MSFDKRAFNPYGPTIKVSADTVAPSGIQAVGAPAAEQFRVMNDGTQTVFYAFGSDAATAQANAVIPTGGGGSSKNSYPIPSGGIEVISAGVNCYWSAITASGTASLYVTPGKGI